METRFASLGLCQSFLPSLGRVNNNRFYAMDHEFGPWKMAFVHGPTSMVRFFNKSIQ